MKRYIRTDTIDIHDENWQVRYKLAGDFSTRVRTLEALAEDPSPAVRQQVAHNINTPLEVLAQLAHDPYPSVRSYVMGNPKTQSSDMLYINDHKEDVSGVVEFYFIIDLAPNEVDIDRVHELIDMYLPDGCQRYSDDLDEYDDESEYSVRCGPIKDYKDANWLQVELEGALEQYCTVRYANHVMLLNG